MDVAPVTNGVDNNEENDTPEETVSKSSHKKIKLSYEKYRTIANTIVMFMRQEEDRPITEGNIFYFLFFTL